MRTLRVAPGRVIAYDEKHARNPFEKPMKRLEYTLTDFAWAKWKPADIKSRMADVLLHKAKAYENIKHIPATLRTFTNTVLAIETSSNDVRELLSICDTLLNVSPVPEVREAAKNALTKMRAALVDFEYDRDIYRAFIEYTNNPEAAPTHLRERYGEASKKLFDDMARDYRRMGFALTPAKQDILKQNLKKLQELETQFSENLNAWQDRILVTREELAGLPDRYIESLHRGKGGTYAVSLQYPEQFPFMRLADNADKRRELMEKELRKGGPKNLELLKQMLALRKKNAQLLGYPSHAAFQTETRMAKTPETVHQFIGGLLRKTSRRAKAERKELEREKRVLTKDRRATLAFHDVLYYAEKLRNRKFKFSGEEVREYFPLETVKRGMFAIYQELLGLRFKQMTGVPVWHEDVEAWSASDPDRSIVGYFMLDLYPRANKYGHAAAGSVIHGHAMPSGTYRTPVSVMMANFPKPSRGNPSLMSHDEVETLFHEFGHVMHQTVTTARYASQSGSNTVLDFVEAQSQMLENWAWDIKPLKLMSGHYKKKSKTLPPALLKKMLAAKKFNIASWTLRQLIYATLDMTLHGHRPPSDPAKLYRELVRTHLGFKLPPTTLFPAGLTHMTEYSAGYYGYLWSNVYAQDMFTRFKSEGILDPTIGAEYRKNILEVGSSRPELESVMAFLGRKPNDKAFLKELGISK